MFRNQIWLGDCIELFGRLPAESIDFGCTSCPWDNIFDYGGSTWDWDTFMVVADELLRVLKKNSVLAWDIGDGLPKQGRGKGFLTGTTARQTVYFLDHGWKLFEELHIYKNQRVCPAPNRHGNPPEKVLIFSKGKPKTAKRLRDKPNKPENIGKRIRVNRRNKDGTLVNGWGAIVKPMGYRNQTWVYEEYCSHCDEPLQWRYTPNDPVGVKKYSNYQRPGDITEIHPARMSSALVRDLISVYTNKGDLVLDPFSGAGTTAQEALKLQRYYLGFEIYDRYVEASRRKLEQLSLQLAREAIAKCA